MAKPILPLVSLCTPTRDRLEFLPLLMQCIQRQTYPHACLEWVVIDNGEVSAEAVCRQYPNLRYLRLDPANGQVPLGKMRNLSHEMSRGEILVNMDDDDFYPTRRVAHAVETLLARPDCLVSGAALTPTYFPDRDEVWVFGPYCDNHAIANSFAFWRDLLKETAYEDEARFAEEKHFLKNYTIPLANLDFKQTVLTMAHSRNTFDKRKLLVNPAQNRARRVDWTLPQVIPDQDLREAYLAAIAGTAQNRG